MGRESGSHVPGGFAAACAAGLITVTLAACSPLGAPAVSSPAHPAGSAPHPATSPVDQAQSTHERPSPLPPAQSVTGAASGPVQAIEAFADEFINWNAQTVAAQMRALAGRSIGQARSAMELAAAQTGQDYELQGGGIVNSGTVEAIAPLRGQRDEYVVVTRELTSATATNAYQGLRPAWHVALASVVALAPGEWVLNGWQPEN